MTSSTSLSIVSYLAPNGFWFYQAVTAHLQQVLGIQVQLSESQFDPLDDPDLINDRIDLAFICGLPFIRRYQNVPTQFHPLVAPVMQSARYANRPVYFSDVIVHANSEIQSFDALYGKTFCYNNPGSNSGYNLPYYHLIQNGYSSIFFGSVWQSGSHQRSIQAVISGKADWAAIDSTVLEQELRTVPEFAHQLRVVESIGPYPMPPIIVAQRLGSTLIEHIQTALLNPSAALQQTMTQAGIQRYEPVTVKPYQELADAYEAVKAGYKPGL
ncbi:phosphate ABC transporter substrate-binding protein [filamentous cyanobacterium CCP1]|nr:phosphate ABC transporter substrate-binding protein [filamentous cyanobacterium CCP2]PSB68163.1 phosphate ABC transporter substrate-binding protein [filamentous cyanobacterium CCP1]